MRVSFSVTAGVAFAVVAAACLVPQTAGEPEETATGAAAPATAITSCTAGARPTTGLGLVPALDDRTFAEPIGLAASPTDDDVFYVVEREGNVRRVVRGGATTTFLALGAKVTADAGEGGLLGFAFHPKFAENGFVFLSYTKPSASSPAGQRSVIARGKSTDGGKTLAPGTIVEVLVQGDDPYWNHNGGGLAFGPDGFLYASFGDGGSGGDPLQYGQNKNVLFGKIVRLDVDRSAPSTPYYAIPRDNPFREGGGRPEIYAWGLRNTWRFSFDRTTGDLWAGDVGQNAWEEIDKIVRGGNYGWSKREGKHCYETSSCNVPGAIDPVVEYDHGQGSSVTGGYVYRGREIPSLQGQYVYGDYVSGNIWTIPANAASPTPRRVLTTDLSIASFAEDRRGELYVVDHGSGKIKRLVSSVAAGAIPERLSQTGCFVATAPQTATARLVPYDVRSPLWSDGADKRRWMALPTGGKITVLPDGDWDLPIGTVLVKEFRVNGRRVETRLFVRHTDGGWAGYAYEWNQAETDATLLRDGKTVSTGAGTPAWTIPSPGQCMGCHNGAARFSLGLETAQLDRDLVYPDGTTQNQLTRLRALGFFDPGAAPTPSGDGLPSPADPTASLAGRARSYLHSNCSFCHRPQAPGAGAADLRFGRTLAEAHVCNQAPEAGDLGVAGARLVVPGRPETSIVSLRMHRTGAGQMPPFARGVTDSAGTAVIDAWIASLQGCP